jgi:hypothetical protein
VYFAIICKLENKAHKYFCVFSTSELPPKHPNVFHVDKRIVIETFPRAIVRTSQLRSAIISSSVCRSSRMAGSWSFTLQVVRHQTFVWIVSSYFEKSVVFVLITNYLQRQFAHFSFIKSCSHEVAKHKSGVCQFPLTVYPAFQLHGHLYTLYFFSLFWGHVFFSFQHNLGTFCRGELLKL